MAHDNSEKTLKKTARKNDDKLIGMVVGSLLTNTSTDQFRYLVDKGAIPCIRDSAGRRQVWLSDVVTLMRKRQQQSSNRRNDLEALLPPDLRQQPADDPPSKRKKSKAGRE